MMNFDQIVPLPQSLDGFYKARQGIDRDRSPKSFPASIVKVDATGTIVTVKFEVLEPGTNDDMKDLHPEWPLQWPETEMPVATDLYGIPPLQVGDMGYCVPADVDLGGVSGYFEAPATLAKMPNLSTLVFHPIGNTQAAERPYADKYFLSGPTGVTLTALDGSATVHIGPVEGGDKNVMQILTLVSATSDAEARGKGVPLCGLYHNNGVVRYQWTVP